MMVLIGILLVQLTDGDQKGIKSTKISNIFATQLNYSLKLLALGRLYDSIANFYKP